MASVGLTVISYATCMEAIYVVKRNTVSFSGLFKGLVGGPFSHLTSAGLLGTLVN